jgi:hypothetical protein
VLLGRAGQHDGVHGGVGAESLEHVGEEGIPVPVVQRHLGWRADDGDHATRLDPERPRHGGVGLEAPEVVLLLQPWIAAGLGCEGAEAVETLLRDRRRHDDPCRGP